METVQMKINEFTKYDLIVLDFMSGEDLNNGLDLAAKDDIEVLQTGTGTVPTIFNIEREGLHGAIFLSHLRNSGVEFDDLSGEGHVPPALQGKSAMMRDAAEEQGFDLTELPMTTDLDEDYYDSEGEGADMSRELAKFGWIVYISWTRDDLGYALYKNINKNAPDDYGFLKVDKATGSWQMQRTKRNNDMATESGDAPELMYVIKGMQK